MANIDDDQHHPEQPLILPTQSSSSSSDSESTESDYTSSESSVVVLSTPQRRRTTTTATATATAVTKGSSTFDSSPSTPYTESPTFSVTSEVSLVCFSTSQSSTMKTRGQQRKDKENDRPKRRANSKSKSMPPPPPIKRKRQDNRKEPPPKAPVTQNPYVVGRSTHPPTPQQESVSVPNAVDVAVPENNAIVISNLLLQLPAYPASQPTLQTPNVEADRKRWVMEWNNVSLQDLLGKDIDVSRIEGVTSGSPSYIAQKKKSFRRFVDTMRMHPLLAPLAEVTGNDGPNVKIKLFEIIGGMPDENKKKLLNNICINYACGLKMELSKELIAALRKNSDLPEEQLSKIDPVFHPELAKKHPEIAKRMYQPSTIQTFLKHIFAVLHMNGIYIQQKEFNNYPGSYLLYWTLAFKYAASIRADFGTRPNRAQVEKDGDLKVRKAISEGKLDITSNYTHCLMYLVWMLSCSFGTRGSKEVSRRSVRKHENVFRVV